MNLISMLRLCDEFFLTLNNRKTNGNKHPQIISAKAVTINLRTIYTDDTHTHRWYGNSPLGGGCSGCANRPTCCVSVSSSKCRDLGSFKGWQNSLSSSPATATGDSAPQWGGFGANVSFVLKAVINSTGFYTYISTV